MKLGKWESHQTISGSCNVNVPDGAFVSASCPSGYVLARIDGTVHGYAGKSRCGVMVCIPAPSPSPAPSPANITVSPNIQTSVSPQISPNFQQQFQPQNSPMTAGTQQATGNTAQPAGPSMADVQSALAAQAADIAAKQADRDAKAQAAQAAMLDAFTRQLSTINKPSEVSPMAYVSAPAQALPPATVSTAAPSLTEALTIATQAPNGTTTQAAPASGKISPWLIGGGVLLLFVIFAKRNKNATR